MRRWRKSAIEFCIKPINDFNIKTLSVVAFNESVENRVWLFTVWAVIFMTIMQCDIISEIASSDCLPTGEAEMEVPRTFL